MKYYSKIENVYKRKDGNPNEMTEIFANPYFEMLRGIEWLGTEKVDGTNTCLYYDGNHLSIHGHTEKTKFNPKVIDFLQSVFCTHEMEEKLEEIFGDRPMCLYGETFGRFVNPKFHYDRDIDFRLFDIYSEKSFSYIEKEDVYGISNILNIPVVPVVDINTLDNLIKYASKPFSSLVGGTEFPAEGIVATPRHELRDKMGARIIVKLKYKDLKTLNDGQGEA